MSDDLLRMNVSPRPKDAMILPGRGVTAVLGPTNTGKTHLAIERMVAHSSGVIGLPLRLLAREVFNRVVDKVGAANVALVTGEEKIQPPGARYVVCTVEAMPRETKAAFVAIDEVQLANDLERGHIFTDRILNLRGRDETLLLGAGTMRGILEQTLRGISVVSRPRMSHLAYAGQKKMTRLPRRSAVVAFSADEVYAIGELIRRQRGGVAVVLGALSPRTRNKQVELYQSGDVDFLVATDAIGMGLNLDVDHVAFAQNRKFDGYQYRDLSAAELGQIAGRAGRHVRDGTFGVTGQAPPLDEAMIEKIEGHDFDPVRVLQWRTPDFDFSSLDALRRSIETVPVVEGLTKALPAVDQRALEHLAGDPAISALATNRRRVALLWDACALPDYRRVAPAQHAELIGSIFQDLARRGHVDETYMAEQVRRADSADGDIDTLSHRIAQIRTWTFVSHRPGWLADPSHWQEKTREIEDRLSDALHERLTKRFVDRRTSVLMRRLRENSMLEAEISPAGSVTVEGHHVGELQGFRFTVDASAGGEDGKAVRAAAQKALAAEFESRADRFAVAANGDFALAHDGIVRWLGQPVATLTDTDDILKPRAILLADEQLTGPTRDKVAERLDRYVGYQVDSQLKPLVDMRNADQLSGIARGVAFRLVENLGLIDRREIADDIKSLDQESRAALRRLGVRFGAYHIFLPALLKPAPANLVTLLWALKNDGKDKPGFGDVVHALAAGRTSVVVDQSFDRAFYKLAGYRTLGRRAVRVDILERLADLIRPALAWKPGVGARPDGGYDGGAFMVTPQMMSILGASPADMEEILKGLGYRGEPKLPAEIARRMADVDARAEAQKAAAAAAAAPIGETQQPASDEAAAEETTANEIAEVVDTGVVIAAGPLPEAAIAIAPVTSDEAQEAEDAAGADDAGANDSSPMAADAIAPVAEAITAETPAGEAPAVTAEAAEEPKPVLIWRPGRFDGNRRHGRDQQRGGRRRQGGEQSEQAAQDGQRPDGQKKGGQRRGGRNAGKKDETPQEPKVLWRASDPRPGRPPRADGDGRGEQPRRENRGPRRDDKGPRKDDRAPRNFEAGPKRDAGKLDPDSPFAKLAALRDQLRK